MDLKNTLEAWVRTRPWVIECAVAALALVIGIAVMPFFIFYGGVAALGRYEGASLGALYSSLVMGLREGSAAAWSVFLGPYALYLLFRALRLWWTSSARWA